MIILSIESFRSVLKTEEVNLRKYKDSKATYNAIFAYIESLYNLKCIHSTPELWKMFIRNVKNLQLELVFLVSIWSDIIKVQCQNCRKREEERQ